MKKIILLFLVFPISLFALENGLNLTSKEKAWLIENPKITMVVPKNFPRSYLNKEGEPQGIDIDYFHLVEKKLGIKFDKTSLNWPIALDKAMNHKVDMIINASKLKYREPYLNFTKVYFASPVAIVSKDREPIISDLNQLCGKNVAVQNGSSKAKFLKQNYPCIKLLEVTRKQDILSSIVSNKAYAGFDNFESISGNIRKMLLPGLKIIYFKYIPPAGFSRVGIRKDKPILHSIMDKAIASITTEEKNKIVFKWLNIKLPPNLEVLNKVTLSLEEKQYLQEKQSINICINPDWMPFEQFDKEGKHTGMTSDYYKFFEKAIGISINVVKTQSWSESLEAIKSRKCDILSLVMETSERKGYINFTVPYMISPLVLATKLNVNFIDELSYLKNEKVGIVKGHAINSILRKKYPNINIIDVKNIKDGFQKVANGELFGFVDSMAIVGHLFQTEFIGELKISGKFEEQLKFGIGVRNDDLILLNILEKAVQSLSPELQQSIFSKYIGIKYEQTTDYDLLIKVLIGAFIIFLIGIYHNRKLAYINKKMKFLQDSLKIKVKEEVEKNKHQQLLMLQQSRLAQMGEMISMIAHQWRQPLNNLALINQTIAFKYERGKLDDSLMDEFSQNSNKQIQGMSKTIDDFRNFFKPEKVKKVFCINEVIINAIDILNPVFIKTDINITFQSHTKFYSNGFERELGQALINIINNAKDALIEHDIKDKNIAITLEQKKDKIIINISDNAGGIPIEIIDKIFDPYFSTKENLNGTGLGLYMTKLIIDEHLIGKITASNTNVGANFLISLKVYDAHEND